MDASIVVRLINETQAGFSKIQSDLSSVQKSAQSAERSFNAVKEALGAFVGLFAGNEVIKFVNTVQTLDNRLKLVTSSTTDLNAKYAELFKVAQDTRAPLDETINLYSRLAQNQDVVGVSGKALTDVVKAFNLSLAISGTSGSEAASAILQFSQAMQSGKLQGDEFRAMAEANPKFLKILSETTGIAREELKKLGSEGFLKSSVLAQALIDALPGLQAEMANTSVTVGQAITMMSNEFQRLGRDFLENSGLADTMVSAIKHITDNAENLIPIIKVVGAVILALGVYFAPLTAAVIATSAAVVYFADVLGPLLKPVVDAAEAALGGLIRTLTGFGAAIKALIKLENPFEAFDKATKEYDDTAKKTTKSTAELSNTTKELGTQTKNTTKVSDDMKKKMQETGLTARLAKNEYTDFINELKQQIEVARLDSKEKEIQQQVYKALAAEIKRFGGDASRVSATRRSEIEAEVRSIMALAQAETAVTEQRKRLLDDLKNRQMQARTDSEKIAFEIQEINKKYKDLEAATNQAFASGLIKTQEELAQRLRDIETKKNADLQTYNDIFRSTEQAKIKEWQNQVLTEQEKYQQGLEEINAKYRAMDMENTQLHQDAILAYKRMSGQKWVDQAKQFQTEELNANGKYIKSIQELETAKNNGLITSQEVYDANRRKIEKEYRDATVQEYSNLYGVLNEKLLSMTGVTQKQFGVIRDTVKLVFGVDIDTIVKEGFAAMIRYVLGFRTQATGDLNGIGGVMTSIFNPNGGTGVTSVGGFATTAMGIFKGFGEGAVGIFSSLGSGILSAFDFVSSGLSSIFSGIGSFLSDNVLSVLGDIISSAADAVSGLFSVSNAGGGGGGGGGGVGWGTLGKVVTGDWFGAAADVVSSIFDWFGKGAAFQSGQVVKRYATGGIVNRPTLFPMANGMGLMGEAGPEAVLPLTRTTGGELGVRADSMPSNAGPVNISFTVNAMDAKDLDRLLIEKRQFITNMVRSAVSDRGGVLY